MSTTGPPPETRNSFAESTRNPYRKDNKLDNAKSGDDRTEFEYPNDPFDANLLVTNDAVGGEPVFPTGHYAGPAGSEPLEASPEYDEHQPYEDDGPSDLG